MKIVGDEITCYRVVEETATIGTDTIAEVFTDCTDCANDPTTPTPTPSATPTATPTASPTPPGFTWTPTPTPTATPTGTPTATPTPTPTGTPTATPTATPTPTPSNTPPGFTWTPTPTPTATPTATLTPIPGGPYSYRLESCDPYDVNSNGDRYAEAANSSFLYEPGDIVKINDACWEVEQRYALYSPHYPTIDSTHVGCDGCFESFPLITSSLVDEQSPSRYGDCWSYIYRYGTSATTGSIELYFTASYVPVKIRIEDPTDDSILFETPWYASNNSYQSDLDVECAYSGSTSINVVQCITGSFIKTSSIDELKLSVLAPFSPGIDAGPRWRLSPVNQSFNWTSGSCL
jgi:hypothetical protein